MLSSSVICKAIENYTDAPTWSTKSEQHIDYNLARDTNDKSDIELLQEWFSKRNPFSETKELISLSSGVVADLDVNCGRAYDIGTNLFAQFSGIKFSEVKFKKVDV